MRILKVISIILVLCFCDLIYCEKDWWEVSAFYQIYPRSFKDSNGDGIGDLKGITEKLPYLKEIGINATWLSPIFQSPMADFGYDISNFFDIQPEYGTLDDFDAMIKQAKELGIKIILDFVPNHSSNESEWFLRSVDRDPIFKDFYIWHPGHVDPKNKTQRLPPNNWMSVFRKSGWEWNEKRQEFYFHQFAIQQPDLNYRNPIVVEVMKSVLRFWLDRGVDGFRIDAVPHLFEVKADQNGNFPDEPKSGFTNDVEDPAYLLHIYTQDQNETIDMVYQWREVVDNYRAEHGGDARVLMTESYSKIDIVKKYFGDGKGRNGSHIPFNFQMINLLNNQSNAQDYKRVIDLWLDNLPVGRTANWVIGNHDQRRVGSRFGESRIDVWLMIIQTLPGISITYNGEEIGMTDLWLSWAETVDPPACNSNPDIYDNISRDPARTPFQWDNSKNGGFSSASKTWLPVHPSYATVNVKAENAAEFSHLKIYKDLIRLRQTKTMQEGNSKIAALTNNVLGILRKNQPKDSIYVTIANIGDKKETVNLSLLDAKLPNELSFIIVGLSSNYKIGQNIQKGSITVQPFESFVLKA